jgi:16S rRNA (uracil1498-N3)-methyltransferase
MVIVKSAMTRMQDSARRQEPLVARRSTDAACKVADVIAMSHKNDGGLAFGFDSGIFAESIVSCQSSTCSRRYDKWRPCDLHPFSDLISACRFFTLVSCQRILWISDSERRMSTSTVYRLIQALTGFWILLRQPINAYTSHMGPIQQRLQRHKLPRIQSSTSRYLNRLLFSPDELDASLAGTSVPSITLPKDDYRTVHASKILKLVSGASVRAGVVGEDRRGLRTDSAVVEWLPEGSVKKAEPLSNGDPPGSLRIYLSSLEPAPPSLNVSVSLILALPRPIQLARMLPMISQMGVDRLVLTEARKVPKDYFGSHLFRQPGRLTDKLVEGLCQAGDVQLPKLRIVRHLNRFLEGELDSLFPAETHARVIAHPQRPNEPALPKMRQIVFPSGLPRRMVIAVGPEGGWEEPNELERFTTRRFQKVTMGERTLRSDCAVISLLSLAHDVCDPYS